MAIWNLLLEAIERGPLPCTITRLMSIHRDGPTELQTAGRNGNADIAKVLWANEADGNAEYSDSRTVSQAAGAREA